MVCPGDKIGLIDKVPSGFTYSHDAEIEFSVESHTVGFSELSTLRANSSLEKYIDPCIPVTDAGGQKQFVKKSFSTDFCASLVHSYQLKAKLPRIARVLTVPLPFRPKGS